MPPVINHTITVSIAGVDRSEHLRKDSLFIRSNIGNTTDVCEFTVIDDGSFTIMDWTEVLVEIDSVRVFGGYITNSSGTAIGDGASKTTLWSVECRDWSALFDVTHVNYSFVDSSDATILSNLFSIYFASDGFDASTHVTSQYDDVDIYFDHISFREALEQLATITKANWHIAPDKSLYWYAEVDPDDAAFSIDTVAPNDSTTFDVLTNSLKVTQDSMEIVNRITVIGGWQQSGTKQIDLLTASSSELIYGPLTQPPSAMWAITFVDSNDVVRTAYANDIGIYPVTVLDDDSTTVYDSGKTYIVSANLDTQYIEFDLDTISPATLKDGSTITVQYYYKEPIMVTRDNTGSQGQYDRIFYRYVFDENLNNLTAATRYADRILDEFGNGRITVRFDVTRHGLLPGRLITINTPAFNISTVLGGLFWASDRSGYILFEDGSGRLALESYDTARKFLIQEVAIQTVVTHQDEFMVVASVTAGRWIRSLTDSAKREATSQYKAGLRTGNRTYGSLSQITGNLGEVATGRALFTDGGTAQFSWTDYADHTGIVVGLEDTGQPAPYGAAYVLQDGTVRAKMGKMGTELAAVGTVTPDGWGIWTSNGYFSGVVSANAGQIGGWTIASNAIYAAGGTLSTGVPPINSSNPGVYMNSAGIFGYGTLGLTFSIPSDPALRPIFSSGTILETVYEVTNAAVIRTGTIFPKVQIDNSGIFAYNSGGTALFTVDSNTGRMTAVDGVFSGSVTATQISGGTVTGGAISGGTVSGGVISGGTVTGALMSAGTVSSGVISGGTVTGALVTGGTVSSAGGSVILNQSQIKVTVPTSFTPGTSKALMEWQTGSGGTVAQVEAISNGGTASLYQYVGTAGQSDARYFLRTYGTAGGASGDYAEFSMRNSIAAFGIVRNSIQITDPLQITAGSITVGGSVCPASDNLYTLGDETHRWSAVSVNSILSADTLTFTVDGAARVRLHRTSNSWEPVTDAGQTLGRSGQRWYEVWASNGVIQTSDLREKGSVQTTPLGLNFIRELDPISWSWKNQQDNRTHYGLSAQDVKRAADKVGSVDFGGYIYAADTDSYHLQYSEFVAPIVAAIQEIADRLEKLESGNYGR